MLRLPEAKQRKALQLCVRAATARCPLLFPPVRGSPELKSHKTRTKISLRGKRGGVAAVAGVQERLWWGSDYHLYRGQDVVGYTQTTAPAVAAV